MKKIAVFLSIVCLFLSGVAVFAQTSLPAADKQQIMVNLSSLVRAVNAGDTQRIAALVSPGNPALLSAIQERIMGGIAYQLDYSPFDENTESLSTDQVKVKARFVASGIGWNASGLSAYFVFERQNNQWLIADTDFHKKLGIDYVFKTVGKVFLFVGPILILFFIFWLWMLIDCLKRKFDDKALWVVLLIFLNFIAAILYFFIIKRKNVTQKPLEFKM